MNSRDEYLDSICGILIIHMILGHIFQWCDLTNSIYYKIESDILFFFMPWFCFKAGMFYKPSTNKICFKKNYNRLIKPYIIFTVSGLIIYSIHYIIINDDKLFIHIFLTPIKQILTYGYALCNAPLWFLFSLFCCKLLYNLSQKCKYFPLLIVLVTVIPYLICMFKIDVPQYISYICTTLVFYTLGNKFKTLQFNKYIFISSIGIIAFQYILYPSIVDMKSNTLIEGNYFIWYISSLAGIITFNNLFKILNINIPFIRIIGKYSMHYFVLHWIIISGTYFIITDSSEIQNKWIIFYIILILNIIILPLISHIFITRKFNL